MTLDTVDKSDRHLSLPGSSSKPMFITVERRLKPKPNKYSDSSVG